MVFYLRSYNDEWKIPFFYDIEFHNTRYMFMAIITEAERVGAIVKTFTADQHPTNYGFFNMLGVKASEPYILSPTVPGRKIFGFFDYVHVYKNLCFALMDRVALLKSKTFLGKKDWEDLLPLISSEISSGYK